LKSPEGLPVARVDIRESLHLTLARGFGVEPPRRGRADEQQIVRAGMETTAASVAQGTSAASAIR
jgi:hypothetical protein